MSHDFTDLIRRTHDELNHYRAKKGLPRLIFMDDERNEQEQHEATAGVATIGDFCECGCGERLKLGTTRKFIRGHRAAAKHRNGHERAKIATQKFKNVMPEMEMDFGPMAKFIDQSIAIYQRKIEALLEAKKAIAKLRE